MIFSPKLAEAVLRGEKTVTRRRLTHRDGRYIRYAVNGLYAVQQSRGVRHKGHIRVLAIRVEPLGALTGEEARLEGFADRLDFIDYWHRLHGAWMSDEIIARIEFELKGRCEKCGETDAAAASSGAKAV